MVEPGQDATSGESGAEDLSSLSSDGEDSDAEDVFQLNAMKVEHLDRPYSNFSTPMATSNRKSYENVAFGCVASDASGAWSFWANMESGGQGYCSPVVALCLCQLHSNQYFVGYRPKS